MSYSVNLYWDLRNVNKFKFKDHHHNLEIFTKPKYMDLQHFLEMIKNKNKFNLKNSDNSVNSSAIHLNHL
jgi:hypothetical protein